MRAVQIKLITANLYIGNNVPVYKDKDCKEQWTMSDYIQTFDDVMIIKNEEFWVRADDMDKFERENPDEGVCYG